MDKKNKKGVSRLESGGFRKKGVISVVAAIFSVSPPVANAHYFVPLSSRPRYSMIAFGRRLPDGSIHSGYVPADTRYDMSAFSHDHSGLVSNGYYRLPWGLKSQIIPEDMARYDMAKKYSRCLIVPQTTLVNKIEDEYKGPSYEERLAASRALTEQRIKEAEERKQQEGLDEPLLFHSYFKSIGIDRQDYNMAITKIKNRTIALYVTLADNPGLVIAWNDPAQLEANSKLIGNRGFVNLYKQKLEGFSKQGKTICEITETDVHKLFSKLEEIAIRLGKTPLSSSWLSELPAYILGPKG